MSYLAGTDFAEWGISAVAVVNTLWCTKYVRDSPVTRQLRYCSELCIGKSSPLGKSLGPQNIEKEFPRPLGPRVEKTRKLVGKDGKLEEEDLLATILRLFRAWDREAPGTLFRFVFELWARMAQMTTGGYIRSYSVANHSIM